MSTQVPAPVGPGKGVQRDRYGRPLIVTPTGQVKGYTRCTTFVDALDDKATLTAWKQRMVAQGLAHRPDILAAVKAVADPSSKEGRGELNRLCEQALEAAGASAKATIGTTLHAVCERWERGEDVTSLVPDGQEPTVAAYQEAVTTHRLRALQIETFGVEDSLQVAGTWDRVYRTPGGETVIGDLKTGSTLDYGAGKFAMQLAVYAHCTQYDPVTGQRTPLPGVSQERALLIHLPEGQGRCDLYWLNIARGWEAVELAWKVRQHRRVKRDQWLTPYTGGTAQALAAGTTGEASSALLNAISQAPTVQALEGLWAAHQGTWQPVHTDAARARKTALTQAA
nr:PD-(D/E)XK nuclease family protein [Actinomyces sp.]